MRIRAPVRYASDACEALIVMYRAMQSGWQPPDVLTQEEWTVLRDANDPSNPLTAFAGFGCSNRGNWFSSFAKKYRLSPTRTVTAAQAASTSVTDKMAKCTDVEFASGDYREARLGEVVYCDPPYAGTLGYPAVESLGAWDPVAFWAWVRTLVADGRLVVVSEQVAPDDFVPLLTFSIQNKVAMKTGTNRAEYLFVHRSQVEKWVTGA